MEKNGTFECENDNFRSYIHGKIGIIKIKKSIFQIVTDLVDSDTLIATFAQAEKDPYIHFLLLINEINTFGDSEYEKFLHQVLGEESINNLFEKNAELKHPNIKSRQINIIDRFILKIMNFNKIIFAGLQDVIVTPIFGACLAADFRFATEKTVFSLTHFKYGLHPAGALPFFLQRSVGRNKAFELLFLESHINAEKALNLNLINKIFPVQDFEEKCIEEIDRLNHVNPKVLYSTKCLLNYCQRDLKAYFDYESQHYIH